MTWIINIITIWYNGLNYDKVLQYYLDGIMHKWANPHFDDFEKKSRCNMEYMIKRIYMYIN